MGGFIRPILRLQAISHHDHMTKETQDLLLGIFYYFSSITTITAGIVVLAKLSINYFIDKGIEKYKTSLNKEVESFKSELKIKESESQIKFSKLHEERATAIKELYNLSLVLQDAIFNLTQPSQGPDWINKSLDDKMYSELKCFQRYFISSKILINKSLCQKIDKFIEECFNIQSDMEEAKFLGDSPERNLKDASIKIWIKSFNTYLNNLQKISDDLVDEYRNILGVI